MAPFVVALHANRKGQYSTEETRKHQVQKSDSCPTLSQSWPTFNVKCPLLGCFHTVLTHKHASNSCKYIGNDDNHACTLSPFPKTTIICGVFAPMRLLLIIQTRKKLAVFLAYIICIYICIMSNVHGKMAEFTSCTNVLFTLVCTVSCKIFSIMLLGSWVHSSLAPHFFGEFGYNPSSVCRSLHSPLNNQLLIVLHHIPSIVISYPSLYHHTHIYI